MQPLSRVKSLDRSRVRGICPVGKEKVYGGKDLLNSQVLSSEWNTERVSEDASGDSEDGEDDELPFVIGESAGDCVWRGSRRSVGSSFHRQGAAFLRGAIGDFQRWENNRNELHILEFLQKRNCVCVGYVSFVWS